ncbi:hypothetical protein QOZ80_1AG0005200 [Eleusine coracana subsp. coracana]|nr:hypothetical protein QOZ80_1AG0005200 [Eleusine coracana subsp. coracana]
MDALLSAVASDLIGRLVSFLIGKYQERGGTDSNDVTLRLQRALLRARVVVEEAEGRQITNRAMLQQLNQLRQQLFRAAYALEAFRWRATNHSRSRRSHAMVSRSPSQTSPAPSKDTSNVLPVMVETLEATLGDMREFVVLLNSCPRLTKQPYSAYLFVERCMFGRQMEKEEVIGFLLKPSKELDVLPIIGPREVGKRTLVEHVCLDERVHERFTEIHRLRSDELDLDSHDENHLSLFDFTARSLMVIDIIDDDTDAEESWRRFHSAIRHRAHNGIKIIIISRTEAHSTLGTVPPLRLRALCREEFWYFFKALAFGAVDPNEHPDLLCMAMKMCEGMGDFAPFRAANTVAASLGTDLSVRSWRRVRKMYHEATMLQLDSAGVKAWCLCRPVKNGPDAPCLFYNTRKLTGVARSELPKITMPEVLADGSLPLAGETRFDVLVWQSRIPPYISYIATCDTDTTHRQQVVALKKRLLNKRRRDKHEDIGTSN